MTTEPPLGRLALRPGVLVGHVATTTALALLLGLYALAPEPVRVQVDMMVSAGTRVELYVNDQRRPPLVQAVVPGARKVYTFDGIVGDVNRLRLDPTDATGVVVEVFSINVVGKDGVLAQFAPNALIGWFMDGLEKFGASETVLGLKTTTSDPILVTGTSIPASRRAAWWSAWLPRVDDPEMLWRLTAAGLVVLLAAALLDPTRRLHLPIAAAAAVLAAAVAVLVPRLPDGPGSAAVAVSRATFVGVSTLPIVLGSIALLAGTAMIGAFAALFRGRPPNPSPEHEQPAWRLTGWQTLAGIAVCGLLTAPDLASAASAASLPPLVPQWDSDNITYWAYLTHNGWLPYRTFWYAYSGMFVYDLPLPAGPMVRWGFETLLFGTFFVALGRLRGTVPAALATLLLVFGHRLGLLPALERYLLPFNVVLAYATIGQGSSRFSSRVPFWAACATAMFLEPPQLVYAGIPVAAMVALDGFEEWRREPARLRAFSQRLGLDFGVPTGLAVILCVVLTLTGQIGGFLNYFAQLGDQVAYSTWPEGLPTLEVPMLVREFVPFAAAGILIAVGVYERLRGGPERGYGTAVAGVGFVLLMVLQKNYVRAMGDQILLPLIAGLAVAGLGWPGRRSLTDYVMAGILLGTIAATMALKPATPAVTGSMFAAWKRVLVDLKLVARGSAAFDRANEARFDPDRFAMYQAEQDVLARLRARAGPEGDVRLFALTDNPILYILTGQAPVWMSNMYNASPVYEQMRVVRWLRDEQPPWVALDPSSLTLDNFQKVVRVPLVFSEVVNRYVPFDSAGRITLLRRRAASDPLPLAYWRERLGADVNVGRLASVSSFVPDENCASSCADLLEVEVPAGAGGATSIPLTIGGLGFSLTFTRVPDETVYRVLLDRIWFWNVGKSGALPRALDVAPPGVRARIRPAVASESVLY